MRRQAILVGRSYTDGKGGVRLILAAGPQYVLYSGQSDTDNLRYKVIEKKRGPFLVGEERNCTRTSFATWAKGEITAREPQGDADK